MPAGLMATAPPGSIPAAPDFARMQRERMERMQAIMGQHGLGALVLLGNTNVVYATGAIWPLADSGRFNFEQPVAVRLGIQSRASLVGVLQRERDARTRHRR